MPKITGALISFTLLILLIPGISVSADEYLPQPDEFIAVEQMPEMIFEQAPIYPEAARKSGQKATVFIKALIDKKGAVRKAMVAKSSSDNPAFEKAALKAAYKNSFTPALQNQQPIAVWITYKVDFSLADNSEPKPEDFIRVGIPAEMINKAEPKYPRLAKRAGMEGTVWIKAFVNKKGEVEKAQISKSSGSRAGFEQAALDAAYKCKFKPAIQNGKPVNVWVTYSVKFRLDDKD